VQRNRPNTHIRIERPHALSGRAVVFFALCAAFASTALPGCASNRPPESQLGNQNRNLHGVVDEQQARIDTLTADKVELARRVRELEAQLSRVESTEHVVEAAKDEMSDTVKRMVAQFQGDSAIEVESAQGGYRFVLREAVLFTTGSATISSEGSSALGRVVAALRSGSQRLTIAGHTDDVPVKKAATLKKFPRGNIELSTARALAVWEYFVKDGGIPASRLSVAGHGPHQPRVPNSSEANRWRNRRVEILVRE